MGAGFDKFAATKTGLPITSVNLKMMLKISPLILGPDIIAQCGSARMNCRLQCHPDRLDDSRAGQWLESQPIAMAASITNGIRRLFTKKTTTIKKINLR
jgi:hypothetical protein